MQKGFTIIELIVVIAIIAVLASIVMVNVSGYINKSRDAAIKGNLSNLMVSAADIMQRYGNYTTGDQEPVCGTSSKIWPVINRALSQAKAVNALCQNTTDKWCASAELKDNTQQGFCVDSLGTKKIFSGDLSVNRCNGTTFLCP